jgi:hypothetical protein
MTVDACKNAALDFSTKDSTTCASPERNTHDASSSSNHAITPSALLPASGDTLKVADPLIELLQLHQDPVQMGSANAPLDLDRQHEHEEHAQDNPESPIRQMTHVRPCVVDDGAESIDNRDAR